MNKIKTQIRSTQRLLNKEKEDQQKIQELNRKIQGLVHQMEQQTVQQHYEKISQRYKAVRFFELKKAKTQEDLLYILYYPLGVKYVSLYKDGTDEQLKKVILDSSAESSISVDETVKSLSVDPYMHEQVTKLVYSKQPQLLKQHWTHIVILNKTIYESLGLNVKQVIKAKLSLSEVEQPEEKDQADDFFNNEKADLEVSKQALEYIPKQQVRVTKF